MSALSIKLTGLAEARRALRRVHPSAVARTQAVIERYVYLIAREAQALAPVDSGDLRQSVRGIVEPLAGAVAAGSPDVGDTMSYAAVVELGRRDNPAYRPQPYLQPAFETYRAAFLRDLRAALRR